MLYYDIIDIHEETGLAKSNNNKKMHNLVLSAFWS